MKRSARFFLSLTLCLSLALLFFTAPVHAAEEGDPCPMDSAASAAPCPGHLIKHYVSELTASTCLEQASYILTCDTCGYSDGISYNDPLGPHEYDILSRTAPTCTEAGSEKLICRNCKDQKLNPLSPTGHSYDVLNRVDPSCTEAGSETLVCRNCKNQLTNPLEPLGHDFPEEDGEPRPVVGTETAVRRVDPTCTEDGYTERVCSRCSEREQVVIPALGHDYYPSTLDPTCTEEGFDYQICSRCGDQQGSALPALGHDYVLVSSDSPACTEDGSELYRCSRCGSEDSQTLPATGHQFPEEWETEKEATPFKEGLKTHECTVCGAPEKAPIPKTSLVPILAAGGGAVALGTGIGIFLTRLKKRAAQKALEEAAAKAALELDKPSIQTRTVLLSSTDEDFITFLKLKKYINAKTCGIEELAQGIEDNEPNVIILDLNKSFTLDDFSALEFEDQQYAFIVSDKVLPDVEEELKQMKKDKTIVGYAPKSARDWVKLVKLFLPVAKPELTSDEGLDNIAMVSDALGIPIISTLINAYVSARDIKSTMGEEEDEMSATDASVIVSDIASILGLDTLSSVAGLVDDIATIKDTLTSEANATTISDGYDAGADIVDVAGELLGR